MLRALAASARWPLSGRAWLASSSSSQWPRAFATTEDGAKSSALAEQSPGASTGGDGGDEQQQQQQPPPPPPDDGWTEVVDDASGKSYWWNQQTGQTTDLGMGRPTERFWRRPSDGGGDDGGAYDDADPHFRDGQGVWREPPGRDKTWSYSVIGVGIGMAAGWLTQYIH